MSSLSVLTAKQVPVLVVGGGVGGLTAALALHHLGIPARVIMKEASLSESPGAVCIMRGALRVIDRLGLGSQVRRLGMSGSRGEVYNRRGLLIYDVPSAKLGSEVYVVPRPLFRQAFLEALPAHSVFTTTQFKRLDHEQGAPQVTAHLRDVASGRDVRVDAECVVGADGTRSHVRGSLARPGVLRSIGVASFRAVARNRDLEAHPYHVFREVWGAGGRRNAGRMRDRWGCMRMTPELVFWWCSYATDGTRRADCRYPNVILRPYRRKLVEMFAQFPLGAAELIAGTSEKDIDGRDIRAFEFDFPWVDVKRSGRVALMGDAARQSDSPYFHNGSSMAIEDGYALAHAIRDNVFNGTIRAGGSLYAYEHERRRKTEQIYRQWTRLDALASCADPISRFCLANSLIIRHRWTDMEHKGVVTTTLAQELEPGASIG